MPTRRWCHNMLSRIHAQPVELTRHKRLRKRCIVLDGNHALWCRSAKSGTQDDVAKADMLTGRPNHSTTVPLLRRCSPIRGQPYSSGRGCKPMTSPIFDRGGNLPAPSSHSAVGPAFSPGAAPGAARMNPVTRFVAALKRFKWLILAMTVVGIGGRHLCHPSAPAEVHGELGSCPGESSEQQRRPDRGQRDLHVGTVGRTAAALEGDESGGPGSTAVPGRPQSRPARRGGTGRPLRSGCVSPSELHVGRSAHHARHILDRVQ